MRNKGFFGSVLVAAMVFASMPVKAAHPEGGENAVVDGFMGDLIGNIQDTETKLVALADAMPADMYGWAPSVGVRTFSETLIHVAAANLFIPMALGAPPAEGLDTSASPMVVMQKMEAEITAKDDVIAELAESFAYVYRALPAIENIDEKVELFGPPASKRSYFFILQGHVHEHLGQAIAYARSVGVAPPWSRPAPVDEDEDTAGESGSD
jgi:uncharacterized damage-inducible protein DinB